MICLRLVLQTTDIKSKYNLESRNVLKIYYILCVIYLSQSQFCIQIFTTYVAQLFLLLFLGTHQHESICVYSSGDWKIQKMVKKSWLSVKKASF